MKTLRSLSENHPLISLILFDLIVSALSIGVGFLIRFKTGWDIATVLFIEAMFFLMIAYSCFNGNAGLKASNFREYREFTQDDSSQLASLVVIKYGAIGVILFFSTWVIR